MRRRAILRVSCLLLLSTVALSTTQVLAAGQRHLYDIQGVYTRIHPWGFPWGTMTINSDEGSYLLHGIGIPTDLPEAVKEPKNYLIEVYLDGEKLLLKRFSEPWPNKYNRYWPGPEYVPGWHKGKPIEHWWNFYQIFEPDYFKPGTYDYQVIWYVNKEEVLNTGIVDFIVT
ncbi:MAG: hypothetical protein ACFFDT_11755 [Candidatus Hodarchaeota archaeon]